MVRDYQNEKSSLQDDITSSSIMPETDPVTLLLLKKQFVGKGAVKGGNSATKFTMVNSTEIFDQAIQRS